MAFLKLIRHYARWGGFLSMLGLLNSDLWMDDDRCPVTVFILWRLLANGLALLWIILIGVLFFFFLLSKLCFFSRRQRQGVVGLLPAIE